ncbi:orotidine 5'-phosphate decarboxylase / HUMPS family protein [Streptomyces sp. NPDC057686]|uniref:orotidine 5'-phosphate decarboxylase / HUMPS family protein n=1 Tax=Streptomyces sp. NPDC057686 TaxID=3346212 RepID=UPI0036A7488E
MGAGCDGVVASPREAGALRDAPGPRPLIVTPGVTPAGGEAGEHAPRAGTAQSASAAGVRPVVVGRSVSRAADPVAALRRVPEGR